MFGYIAAVTPDELQGRVMSVLFTAAMSLASIAPLLAGLLYEALGARGTVLAFAGILAVAAVIASMSTGIRRMRDLTRDPVHDLMHEGAPATDERPDAALIAPSDCALAGSPP